MINTVIYGVINGVSFCLGLLFVIRNFPEKRFRSKWMQAVEIVFFLCLGVLEIWDGGHAYIQNLQIIGYAFINAVFLKTFYRCRYLDAAVMILCYNINFGLLKVPVQTLRGVWTKEGLGSVNVTMKRIWAENLWCILILAVVVTVYLKKEEQIRFLINKLLEKNRIIILALLTVEYWALLQMMGLGMKEFDISDFFLSSMIIFCFALSAFAGGIYWIYQKSKKEQENILFRQKILQEEQRAVRMYYEQDARRLHDMKHLLIYLQSCIKQQDLTEAMRCLNTHLGKLAESSQRLWTGLPEVDFMINYEYQKMKKQGIEFQLETDLYEIPIDTSEFMVVLGNLLDNAIEAAEQCAWGHRKVTLNLKSVSGMLIMEVNNTYKNEPVVKAGRLISSKRQKELHGWGLENVRQIVEANEGEMQTLHKEGIFQTKILFYGEKAESV